MRRRTQRRLGAFVLVPLLALVAACGGDDPSAGSSAGDTHNDSDVSFASDMIAHHAQAIEMAEMAPSQAQDPEVVDLANQISDAQQPEIDTMSSWLEAWGEPVPDTGMGSMSGMDHGEMAEMMTPEDMQRLTDASGREFDRLWLEMMMEHHKGAIDMSETELQDGENADAKELAQTIIDSQEAEISTMQEMLSGSGG